MGKKKSEAIVLDVNVIISALINPKGRTASLLTDVLPHKDTYTPEKALLELEKHFERVVLRKGRDPTAMYLLLDFLLKNTTVVPSDVLEPHLKEALTLVNDPSDAPYAATALHLKEKHNTVLILTFNKKDYKEEKLKEKNIHTLSPEELTNLQNP